MGLRFRLDLRVVFVWLYVLAFVVYLIIGLQPAEATNFEISGRLSSKNISLDSDVTTLSLENNKLNTPDLIVGAYSRSNNKTLLIGHSTTVFKDLNKVQLGNIFDYNDKAYQVMSISLMPKAKIDMDRLLLPAKKDTLIIMTCAGQLVGDGDATHRLILTAVSE